MYACRISLLPKTGNTECLPVDIDVLTFSKLRLTPPDQTTIGREDLSRTLTPGCTNCVNTRNYVANVLRVVAEDEV